MMTSMRIIRALAALVISTSAAPLAAQAPGGSTTGSTTVIVVRHAERAADPAADPLLTPAGAARAEALAELLKDAHVDAVVSTQLQRTRLTGAPVAARFGLTPEIVEARAPQHPRAVADTVLLKHRGQTVLVVGHSNTVPDIVAALGAPKPANICDGEYDNLYVVTVPPEGAARVVRARYGAPSPADSSCRAMR
jgi:broad specificity phosphatase PhoE